MTISDRRIDRIWRRKVQPIASSVKGWDDLVSPSEGSSWTPADKAVLHLRPREAGRLGSDLALIWRTSGREALLPLASAIQHLVDHSEPAMDDQPRELSSTVYEMH